MEYITIKEALKALNQIAKENNFDNDGIIKWIVVKSMRLNRDQFDKIINVKVEQFNIMKKALKRYIQGETLSQIFGFIEFCGNIFNVTENVFDPRLSTESLVYSVVNAFGSPQKKLRIIDLCTGSGCVAITIAKMLNCTVDALDISPLAIEIAKQNATNLGANVNFIEFDLNEDWSKIFKEKYDIIVSNPPYWNTEKILKNEDKVKNNPLIGFNGGVDGLKYIKIIISNARKYLKKDGMLFLEIDPDQIETINTLLKENGFTDMELKQDYRGIDRVVSAKNTGLKENENDDMEKE